MNGWKRSGMIVIVLGLLGCTVPPSSFSLNEENDLYKQQLTLTQRKVDVLWVMDNSNSMASSQTQVAENFSAFIDEFVTRDYDFRLAITSTDAWLGLFDSNEAERLLYTYDGRSVLDNTVSDLTDLFVSQILLGTSGYGDERAFQSMLGSLQAADNSDFLRSDAYLSVIIVSDEDDFSTSVETFTGNNYDEPTLISVQDYYDELLDLKNEEDLFSVSALTITDDDCLSSLQNDFPGRRLGQRYVELAEMSNGVTGSLCGDFSIAFEAITSTILELTNIFPLEREPVVETIEVQIDGELIENDEVHGWTYNAEDMQLELHGDAIPLEGDLVVINYDPVGVKE